MIMPGVKVPHPVAKKGVGSIRLLRDILRGIPFYSYLFNGIRYQSHSPPRGLAEKMAGAVIILKQKMTCWPRPTK